ncbi:hypothetical protein CesoFtcFv8_021152 [Champsocephalus esox]|uniref:Uncharacterized protein n=1 Tax=Champsocephalus esox TaxID=159716 RepID=A0AAN8BCC5_9TELE|nr:hypothetical protein CesoFtcFv8_021152 [Champsocephalus esox]
MTRSAAAHALRVGDAHACFLQSIHSQGGVTPPPLTDCFLPFLFLNYFFSDSHMWVFSSLPCGGGELKHS